MIKAVKSETSKTVAKTLLALMVLMLPAFAFAGGGGGGSEFEQIWTTLEDWVTGTLGRIIALTMVIVGIVYGIGRQNIMAFVMGPAAGMGLYYAPQIIEGVMGAGLGL